ncbi:MAG: hypothetical protein ACFE9V_13740, partial [Candidatus Hodarchaeota archaeon]
DWSGNFTFSGSTGQINQGAWDLFGNGTVTIRFYANDTLGNFIWEEVVVRKDVEPPSIIFNSPTPNQLFGTTAPDFDITIIDPQGLNTSWYQLHNGTDWSGNFTFSGSTGQINQGAWDLFGNGTVTIRFYANDTLGNLGWEEIIVRKDIEIPSITINSPTPSQLFGTISPDFDVIITDPSGLNTTWYQLHNGTDWSGNFTFSGSTGQIDQGAWDLFGNGTVTIRFYANDSAGNLIWDEVVVRKDIELPSITINSPTPNQLFGTTAPDFDITIIDPQGINTSWYQLHNGTDWSGNFTFSGSTGQIDQSAWDLFGNGTVTIRFYANDSAGNLVWEEVIVRKDIELPSIAINSPVPNQIFGTTAPDFDVIIADPSGIHTTWYQLHNGTDWSGNFTFIGSTGPIDQSAWDLFGNGTVTIRFYANDTLGNLGWEELVVRKDIELPSITINSPTPNQLFGTTAPDFDATITDPSGIHTKWYQLHNGTDWSGNFTFSGSTGQIDQSAWDLFGNGTVTIRFYANDSAGNLIWEELVVRKDVEPPSITINSPMPNQLFGTVAPNYNVTITDPQGINTSWYQLYNSTYWSGNFTFSGSTGQIDQSAWDLFGNGTITIRFYANDTFGNLGYEEIIVQKDILAPIITVNSPTPNQLCIHEVPNFDLTFTEGNLNVTWYTIDGGLTNFTFTGTSGTIDQIAWNRSPNGTVTIRFYANDTFGNLGYSEVSVVYNKYTPKPFILSSDADSPDTDGQFVLNWTISVGADNYTIYMYNSLITDINSSVIMITEGITYLNYSITVESGIYYFLIVSFNNTGHTHSNNLIITVEILADKPFDLAEFLTEPFTLYYFGGLVVAISLSIIIRRKRYYKSSSREISRIHEIRRKE